MGFLTSLIGGGLSTKIAGIVLLVLLAMAGTWVGLKVLEVKHLENKIVDLNKDISKLQTDNTILIANNKVLKDNQLLLAASNDANMDTIKKLQDERAAGTAAVSALAARNQRDQQAIAQLNTKLSTMLKDPKNDGAVSPILREIGKEIQAQRGHK